MNICERFDVKKKDLQKELGSVIKKLRKEKMITQEQLADDAESGLRTIKRVEAGKTNLSTELLEKICKVFGKKPSELLKLAGY